MARKEQIIDQAIRVVGKLEWVNAVCPSCGEYYRGGASDNHKADCETMQLLSDLHGVRDLIQVLRQQSIFIKKRSRPETETATP